MSLKNKLTRQLGDVAKPVALQRPNSAPAATVNTDHNQIGDDKRAMLLKLQQQLSKIAPTTLGSELLPPTAPLSKKIDNPQVQKSSPRFDPCSLKGAKVESTPQGEVFFVDNCYQLPYLHGSQLLTSSTAALAELTANRNEFATHNLANAVFFDLETTGLAGGSGTIPFMIGAGKLVGEHFIIRQYFARKPTEELAILSHFRAFIGNNPIVSFNGQTFDLPMLTSRLIMNRLPPDMDSLPHLDLITLSRRLWKARLKDCSLKNIEENCLGIQRSDDVDGGEVPQIYLDYLNGRPTPIMERVFYHNKIDILSLLALSVALVKQIKACASGQALPEDLYSYAHFFLEEKSPDEAIQLFSKAASSHFCRSEVALNNLISLALVTKKQYGRAAAICHWQRIIDQYPHHFEANIELCKYLEHDLKNYDEALKIAKKCRNWPISLKERQDLEHRINRLKSRLEGPANFEDCDFSTIDP